MHYIAIDGPGGSGKTHLTNALGQQLDAQVFHLDDYGNDYEPFVGIPKLVDAVSKANTDIVIFEGVGVFDSRFDQFSPFRIFVNTSPDVRRQRALSRDVPTSDRSADEWKKIYDIWRKAEQTYFTHELIARADLCTDEDGSTDVEAIAEMISTHKEDAKFPRSPKKDNTPGVERRA